MAETSFSQVVTYDISHLAQALYSSLHLQYIVLIVLAFTIVGYLIDSYGPTDPCEPQKLRPSFPLIGHLMGMFSKHTQFYDDLYRESGMAIATLPILGGKMYAIWDSALIQSGLRAKTMSFDPIMFQHAGGLMGLEKKSVDIARDGMLTELMHITKPMLAGESLARISATVLNYDATVLNNIRKGKGYEIPDLYDWVQTTVTLATTEAFYGSANPLQRDRSLVDDVWSFESGLRRLAVNIFPSIIAPRAYRARNRLVAAIAPLLDETHRDRKIELPELTRRRVEVMRRHGLTDPTQMARVEFGLLHVATVNTAPTLFWTIAHLFANPELLTAIRNEALPLVTLAPTSSNDDGAEQLEAHFPITKLLDSACPLLLSTYREITRLVNQALPTRHVLEDTLLTDAQGRTYLVRAGNTVVMPATVHASTHVWGPDANDFNPRRFLDWSNDKKSPRDRRHASYMPFGGGKHLCPGRNLAQTEILGTVLALALQFDVEDAASASTSSSPSGSGRGRRLIRVPEREPARLGVGVGKPVGFQRGGGGGEGGRKLAVRMVTREGWEGVRWRFVV